MPPDRPPPPPEPAPALADGGSSSSLAGALWAVLVLAAATAAAFVATRPPAPRGPSAPETEFSAARARARLERVLASERPHPVGSEEHAALRARLLAEWRALGYEPEVQTTVARGPEGEAFARVHNVLARLPGRAPGPAVLLAAHYDSVAAGPGASDDGIGLACLLECARALAAGAAPGRDVVFLASDAEEPALAGAVAFRDEHPWAEEIGAAVNLEMRGTGGRSLLFQTGPDTSALLAAYARTVRRPAAHSLAAEVYRHMPNDTDFTVFLEAGWSGANLAGIGGHARYHTPLDRLEHLDDGTLQHEGEQALALVRALTEGALPSPGDGERVYTDVLGLFVVGWPAGWTAALALLVLALGALAVARLRRGGVLATSEVVAGALALLALVAVAGALGVLWTRVLRALTGADAPWHADPVPTRVGYAALSLFALLVTARTVGRTAGFWGLWCAGVLGAGTLGLVLAVAAPGASFVFLVPGLVGGLLPHVSTALRAPREARGREIALVLTLAAGAVVWLPLWVELELALGAGASLAAVVPFALLGAVLAPLASELRPAPARIARVAALVLALAAGARAATRPPFDAEHPQRLNLHYLLDGDADEARWAWWTPSGAVPPEAVAALGEGVVEAGLWSWAPRPMLVPEPYRERDGSERVPAAPAPLWGPLAPVVDVAPEGGAEGGDAGVAAGEQRVRARLRSLRAAEGLHLVLPDGARVESVTVGERTWPAEAPEADGDEDDVEPPGLSFWGLGDEGVEVVWVQPAGEEFAVFDSSSLLPPQAEPLLAARPAVAVPTHGGDTSLLFRRRVP